LTVSNWLSRLHKAGLLVAVTVFIICISARAVAAEDEHQHPNHLAVLVGNPQEVHADGERVSGGMLGVAYERRFSDRWSLALAYEQEAFGDRTERRTVIFAGASYNLNDHWKVFGGPGGEGRKLGERGHFLFRVGTGYHFSLGRGFSLSPEFSIDIVEGGNKVYLFALALGYGF
jgi:hypothetical protein